MVKKRMVKQEEVKRKYLLIHQDGNILCNINEVDLIELENQSIIFPIHNTKIGTQWVFTNSCIKIKKAGNKREEPKDNK